MLHVVELKLESFFDKCVSDTLYFCDFNLVLAAAVSVGLKQGKTVIVVKVFLVISSLTLDC